MHELAEYISPPAQLGLTRMTMQKHSRVHRISAVWMAHNSPQLHTKQPEDIDSMVRIWCRPHRGERTKSRPFCVTWSRGKAKLCYNFEHCSAMLSVLISVCQQDFGNKKNITVFKLGLYKTCRSHIRQELKKRDETVFFFFDEVVWDTQAVFNQNTGKPSRTSRLSAGNRVRVAEQVSVNWSGGCVCVWLLVSERLVFVGCQLTHTQSFFFLFFERWSQLRRGTRNGKWRQLNSGYDCREHHSRAGYGSHYCTVLW